MNYNKEDIIFVRDDTKQKYLFFYANIDKWDIKKYDPPYVIGVYPLLLNLLSSIDFHMLLYLNLSKMKIANI